MENSSNKDSHNFKKEYFAVPTWCFICKDFIWGITKGQQKGFKCHACHGAAHKKCLDRAEKCEPHQSLRNSQKPEKPPKTREQTQEKIERKQQQNCNFPLPAIKGERSLQTLVLECEVTVEVYQGKLLYFPGQSIGHTTRADVSTQYAAIAQKCSEGYFPAYIQQGGVRTKVGNAIKPFQFDSRKFETMKRIFLQRDVQYDGHPLDFQVVRIPIFMDTQSQSKVSGTIFQLQVNTQGETNASGTENILPIVVSMAQEGWRLNCFEVVQQIDRSSTKLDIGDLFDGKLSSSFQGAMDLFFTRYSPQPLPTEFGSLNIIARLNVQTSSQHGVIQNTNSSSVQYNLGLEELQESIRAQGWSILGLTMTGEMTRGGGQANMQLFGQHQSSGDVGAGFLVLVQRGLDTPKNPLIAKVTTQTEMQTNFTGFNTNFGSTDAAITAYGTAGYKPLIILMAGTSMGAMRIGKLPKISMLQDITFTNF